VVPTLLDEQVMVFFVTHRFDFADWFLRQHASSTIFLRAGRQPDGSRDYKLAEKAPLPTSFGEDLYYRLGRWLEGDAAEFTRRPLPPGTATVMASVTVMAPAR
jgi:hypothetical protein